MSTLDPVLVKPDAIDDDRPVIIDAPPGRRGDQIREDGSTVAATEPLQAPLSHQGARFLKRSADLLVCVLALPVLLLVIPIIAVLIKLDSRGSVFFRQPRVGRGGRSFPMLKFRSMHPDAEERLAADPELYRQWMANDCKLPEEVDPRVTRVGRVLRASSLDELPQLLNVLLGQMSMVGPRPIEERQVDELYGDDAAVYRSVKPGLTGLWQVSGRSSIVGPARASLDIEYVATWSPWLDIRLLVRTLPAVLRREGAH